MPLASVSPKRSVLFVLPSLQGGGAERVILTLLRHLDRSKFDLALAILDSRDPVYLSELPKDVELIDLKCHRVRYSAAAILKVVWKRRPDVVFSTIGHLNLGVALMKPLFPRHIKLIARETVVVSQLLSLRAFPSVWKLAYRLIYHLCDRIVCQSKDMRDDLVRSIGLPAEMMVIIHNPVDVARVQRLMNEDLPALDIESNSNGGRIRLVAIGRLDYQKGFDILIRALSLAKAPQIQLSILGDGPLRPELEDLARKSGVSSQIRFMGFQRNPYPYVRRAHALVLSSRYEGLPNVVLESLACGTPVIATPAPGGIFELLEGREGCVIAEAIDAESLARAIKTYPFEGVRHEAMPHIAEFSAESICAQYSEVLASV